MSAPPTITDETLREFEQLLVCWPDQFTPDMLTQFHVVWRLLDPEQGRDHFAVGDRVYDPAPVNEGWNPEYTATILAVHGDLIDIRWDHGPTNYGQSASEFRLRAAFGGEDNTR